MRLNANAVVFIFDEPRPGGKVAVVGAERDWRCEHESDRCVITDRNRSKRVLSRRDRHGADVPSGACRPPDGLRLTLERRSDCIEDQPLAQPDPQFARDDLHNVGCFERLRAGPEDSLAKDLAPPLRAFSFGVGDLAQEPRQERRPQRVAPKEP